MVTSRCSEVNSLSIPGFCCVFGVLLVVAVMVVHLSSWSALQYSVLFHYKEDYVRCTSSLNININERPEGVSSIMFGFKIIVYPR